ncbi:MAG: hypothetical protein ACI32N_02940 [Bulleidia sp.]
MKKLKLRKEVKFITASIALGLTLCAVPTMKVIAEDDTVDTPVATETEDLYTRLMTAETIEEFEEIVNAASDEETALLTEEQFENIDIHISILLDDPKKVENDNYLDNNSFVSEIVVPSVNFTNVAPLVDMTNFDN